MGFRIRRSARPFAYIESNVCTSIGAPGTGIDLYQPSTDDRKFLVATVIVLCLVAAVWLLA